MGAAPVSKMCANVFHNEDGILAMVVTSRGNVLYNEHGILTKIVTCKLPTPPRKTKGRERKEERRVVGLGREC